MSLDDEMAAFELHKREREYRDPWEFEDGLVREDCESEEAADVMWAGIFAAMPWHVRNTRYGDDSGSAA